MKVVILEDESAAARRLEKMIKELDPDILVLDILESVSSAVAWFKTNKHPDLVLMDIHLADGSSFEIFEKVELACPVIFTTAYDQYAIQAFKVNSIDFLLKPIKEEELKYSFEQFEKLKNAGNQHNIKSLLEQFMGKTVQYQQRFAVKSGQFIKSIEVSNIALFYAEEKLVFIYTLENQRYTIDVSLDKLAEQLDPGMFFRINRGVVLNFYAIKQMASYLKGRIKIETKTDYSGEVIVSSERATEFKSWLNR